jgi:tripartite-type tricarboxylate transporter receptor subunit TctC
MKRLFHTATAASTAVCLGLGLSLALPGKAVAQAWPSKPIRIVLGFAPGAITDTIARAIGNQVSKSIGQPVLIDNRAGAGGTISADAVARAAPDGYTILLGEPGGMSINPLLMPGISYNVARDFAPIAQVVTLPVALVANPGAGVQKLADLQTMVAANKALAYGSPGPGSHQHLSMELLKIATSLPFIHVPYKGGAPAITDLLGGQIPLVAITVPTVAAQVKQGRIVALAILGKTRSAAMPDVPTVVEAGFPQYSTPPLWQGFFAPANTPKDIVNRLNAEIRKALDVPEVRNSLQGSGAEVVVNSPEEFAKMLREETPLLTRAIQAGNVKAQ